MADAAAARPHPGSWTSWDHVYLCLLVDETAALLEHAWVLMVEREGA